MNNTHSKQRFTKVLREDLRNARLGKDIRNEFRELRNFYLNEEQKKRLEGMRRFHRFFHQFTWIIKSIFLHLTPTRRILTVIGAVIILLGSGIFINDGQTDINNTGLVGGGIIFIVLMLELKDKLLAKDELEAGRKVQRALTPERSPKVDGWSIWLYTRPANEVGGDLVDYIKINENKVGIILADVTGKGLQAALLMAKLQATIRALAADFNSLSGLCTKINNIFYRDSLSNTFASMIYLEIIPNDSKVRFVNAGHFPPILIKNDDITETSKSNTAIGLAKDFNYKEDLITMESGEILIAYTDGVTEARNENGMFFEKERLLKILPNLKKYKFEDMGELIVSEVDYFVGDAPFFDDLSLLILKKN